jgi:hypothetical protein
LARRPAAITGGGPAQPVGRAERPEAVLSNLAEIRGQQNNIFWLSFDGRASAACTWMSLVDLI